MELLEGKPDQEKTLKVMEKIDAYINKALVTREDLVWEKRG